MNRNLADPAVLAPMLYDYAWCVANGLFEDTAEGWLSFLAGFVDMEERSRRRTWRRPRQRRAA